MVQKCDSSWVPGQARVLGCATRFLQTDPFHYADGLNLYSYCGNNSIIWRDPYGLWTLSGGAASGFGFQGSFGYNGGQWSGSIVGGVGIGANISFNSADTGSSNPGFSATGTVSAGVDAGVVSSGASAEASYGANTGASGTVDAGAGGVGVAATVDSQGNVSTGVTGGVGSMAFAGVGVNYTGEGEGEGEGKE